MIEPVRLTGLTRAAAGATALGWADGVAEAGQTLAALPEPGGYTSWVRIVVILLAMVPWMAFCQWVDKDTAYLRRINRPMWNGIILGSGTVGLLCWLFMPWKTPGLFAAGFGLWFVLAASTCTVYVVVRNGLVDPGARVFTPRHLKAWFSSLGKKQEEIAAAIERVRLSGPAGKVQIPNDPTQIEPYENAQNLLYDALWRRATEVEMLVSANAARLAYRIDGVVTARHDLLARENAEQAMTFIKKVAGLDVNERRKPQSGEIVAAIEMSDRGNTDIEVKASGTTQHERLSLRIIGEETRLRINDLGMHTKIQERIEALVGGQPSGLFVISGPRASGVTTTLYALLRMHDAFMTNLLTLEREPLRDLENITQYIYDPTKHDGSYSRQLQTVLRREPDAVMVSDCPDRETAHLAVKAAAEGKRIYMGMLARDSFEGLKKLVNLAGDTDLAADVLRSITSQRLVRKLCVACRIAYKPDISLLRKANLPVDKIEHFYRPPKAEEMVDDKGNPRVCPNCQNSGYYGRTGLFEMLEVDQVMRQLIANGQPLTAIRAQARKNGMLYLQEVGLQKVMEGVTGMNEMLRVLRDEEGGTPAARGNG
ncbi:MAG TPA: ATPase, T2SS/T4P/T4SS family [Phycisphaerae bacterium]|nr:ATPase, T2SS/T4P/T4SS family [Phycisphaerae bacterium]